jgi:hypothetical protein
MTTRLTEMNAKITADTDNILAGLERVKRGVQDVSTTSTRAGAVSGKAFDGLAGSMDKVGRATGGALNAIYALEAKGSARILALGNAVGNLAGIFGPQGKMVQGIAIVGSAIAALLLQAREKSAEATKAIADDIRELTNAGELAPIDKKLRDLYVGSIASGGADGIKAIRERIALLKQERAVIQSGTKEYKTYADFQQDRGENLRQLRAETDALNALETQFKSLENARELVTNRLTATAGGRGKLGEVTIKADSPEALARKADQLADKLNALRKRASDLFETLDGSSAFAKARNDIEQWADDAKRAGVPAKEITEGVGRLYEALDRFEARKATEGLKGVTSALEHQNDALGKRLTQWLKEAEERDALARQQKNAIGDLEREAAAIAAGTDAYKEYQRELSATLAVRAAKEKASTSGKTLTAKEIQAVRDDALALFDAGQRVALAIAEMSDAAEGGLLKAFSELAQQATTIATSLGDAGKNIAQIAAIAGPLFSGFDQLTKGLQLRDKLGNIVKGADGKTQSTGFLDALRGKNGSESQAQALTGALGVVGAVATIADAVDLFGTKAKQRAKEMQEAAREFAKGLQDFVASANPSTGATEAIKNARRQAEELAKQAAAAGGGTFNAESEVNAASLRAEAALIREAAVSIGNKKFAAQLITVAEGFDDLADGLEKVEKAAREQVLRNIEDLNVRRLAALGLTDEAEALRKDIEQRRELEAAQKDVTEEGRRYYFLLRDTIEVEKQRAYIEEQRHKAFQLLDDSIAVFGGSGVEVLKSTYNTIKQLFPQFAGLFDGLDLSTTEGLSSAKDKLQDLFRELTADGIITDAERPIVEAIKRLLGNIEAAFGELADPLAAALEVFAVRVDVFGLSLAEQFEALAEILGNAFPELDDLLTGADGSNLEDIKTSIQARIAALLEGGIDESEVPLLAALQQLLANIIGQIDEAAQEAEEAARAAEQARQERVNRANRTLNAEIQLGGLSGADALQARVRSAAAQSPILAQLLPLFGDTSAAGIRATKDALFALFRDIDAGRVPIELFGDLTEDEIIAKIIELNGNLDGLAESLTDAAKAAAEAAEAERQATTDLRTRLAKSRGEDTRLQEFDVAASREREAAQAAGRSAAFLQFLDQVLASERTKLLADIAGEAVTASLNAAAEVAKNAANKSQTTEITRSVGSLTEVTGQTLAGYLRSIDQNTRTSANADTQIAQLLSGMRAPSSIPIPSLPSSSTFGGRTGQTIIFNVAAPALNVPVGASPDEVGRVLGAAQVRAISEAIGRLAQTDIRHLGRFDV